MSITVLLMKESYGESSKWTHVAGSIGSYDLVEGQIPKSRVCNLQENYVEKGIEIRVTRKSYTNDKDRTKVALWWATMNNTPYDFPQLLWFGIGARWGNWMLSKPNIFNSKNRLICSELIANGFYKEGYNLFNKSVENILPADYDNSNIFDIVTDIWLEADKKEEDSENTKD